MSQRPEDVNPLDPFAAFRSARDATMETWSKAMIDAVNTDAYSQAMGSWLDTYLTVSAPLRQTMETAMTQVLTQLNMPTRSDITALAERLTNIEMRLDDLDAGFDSLDRNAPGLGGKPGSGRSARTKKGE
jgi:polyhydroxyalkanoic acid synthase PhaR subunit